MKWIAALLLLSPSAFGGCIEQHLSDAIALNTRRMPIYAALSGGTSSAVSLSLIGAEELAKITAKVLDEKSIPYRNAGIGLFCDDLLSMSRAPRLDRTSFKRLDYDYKKPPIELYQALLAKRTDFVWIERTTQVLLNAIEPQKGMHCMIVHIAETIERTARLAPAQIERAKSAGLESPEALSREFISQLLGLLEKGDLLDRMAAPLHKAGIPIVCQDVP